MLIKRHFSDFWCLILIELFLFKRGKSTEIFNNSAVLFEFGSCENWTNIDESLSGKCIKYEKNLQCFYGIEDIENLERFQKIEELILCGWPNTTFDPPTILKHFPRIRTLRIEFSNLIDIINDFPNLMHLENINISWTKLNHTRHTLFKRLHNLKNLDLRWNQLNFLEGPLAVSKNFKYIYLNGNPWNCTKNLKWLMNPDKNEHFVDRNLLQCADYKYLGRHLLTVMHFKLTLKQECQSHEEIRNCSCSMHYIRPSDDGKSFTPIYSVNCSYLNFYNFPAYLPKNTTIFYANGNQISDVKSLRNNVVYRSVYDVYLDFNQIQSLDVLEAGFWLHNFRVLSLKGNKLNKLPVYALDNALEKNDHVSKLHLSLNPWICDCKFTMRFREFLMKFISIVKDSENITCKYIEGDDNFMAKVLDLDRGDVCKLPNESKILPLDLLNGVLATLIIFILSKLAYDYYHYKKYGRVPWIVTKIP